ncbi:filamentous hemagglutinin N-terminal domain-containing protein [Scytonema sp. UIC 10036]|uniref:two-partner secretion domain-containing protein n=1 Tax=Scytonema sp. UIC 10036 TaxID=2304196 RepID=UPI0012DA8EA0|nr:filamentous hemagglutinin N-terminal domain-containing protein [Scytonema sp. UIC 10036]MUG97444.1 filamentous hemagglutinin N-terminal domain-containing protein [Scytonema sp. UIC 10036]
MARKWTVFFCKCQAFLIKRDSSKSKFLAGQFLEVLLVTSSIILGNPIDSHTVQAQLSPDNTLGSESSTVIPINGVPVELITGGARRGSNLFHSFREFNVEARRGVYFNNPVGIENILTRVTGNNPSRILGRLGVNGNANLFLMNPKGIIFGSEAFLDLRGSFVATTASEMIFDGGSQFSAMSPEAAPLLAVNIPVGLNFRQPPGKIFVNGFGFAGSLSGFGLNVLPGKTLALVGGEVEINAGVLNTPGGQIQLGGLTAGTVELQANGNNVGFNFPQNLQRADVILVNGSIVDVSGNGTGEIAINAQNLDILSGSLLFAGIGQGLGTPETVGGDIRLNATGEINIAGFNSGILNLARSGSQGNGGNITIDAASLKLQDGAQVIASTFGQGNAGNVTVSAKDAVSLTGNASVFSTVEAGGVGKGGNIGINAATLSLQDGAQLQTITRRAFANQRAGQGDAGNVNVKVSGEVNIAGVKNGFSSGILSRVETGAVGNGGNITIDAASFKLQDGTQLAALTFGQGNAGNVTVSAKDAVSLTGNSYIFSTVEASGVGKGGNIDINAATLSLQDGAQLQTITRGAFANQRAGQGDAGNVNVKVSGDVDIAGVKNGLSSAIGSSVGIGAKGNGGNITIDAGSFLLRDGAQLSASTSGQGNAGNVTVRAKDGVSLTGNASIFSTVEASGVGKGGNININAATLSLQDGTQLLTITRGASDTQRAGQGDAGNVNVKVSGDVNIAGVKNGFTSGISSSVETGTVANGGNITIDAGSFKLQDGAQVSASTSGQGNAGNVTVSAKDAVSLTGNSYIFSTVEASGVGKGGNINIHAATLSLQDGAQLQTITRGAFANQRAGQGDAGNVNVKVFGDVDIAGAKNGLSSAIGSSVDTGTRGNGGNITIDAGSFWLRDGAQLSASTFGQGNAGNVTVSAKDAVSLTGNASIFSAVQAGGIGKGGNIDINAATLSLQDGAQLVTITRGASANQPAGQGDAGNVNVKVSGDVDIAGVKNGFSSGMFSSVDTETIGNGGNITIDTGSFLLKDGALLDASTQNNNRGGNITLNANVVETLNGGQLTTNALSNGRAGKITVNATDKVIISGSDQNYNDRVTNFPNNIRNVGANSGFFVSSRGLGITGDIEINSPKITLDNQGRLNAESASGNGGNINLNSDLLLLRRNSQMSTNAGTEEKGGDGGNVNINSQFIVALPNSNSDITANAYSGKGGNVNIRTQGIFGIQARPKLTNTTNDITASSQLGVQGQITINQPEVDPSQGLVELPQIVIDPDALIAQNPCVRRAGSEFVVTGKGGLPPSPNQALNADAVEVDLVEPAPLTIAQKQPSTNTLNDISNQKPVQMNAIEIIPAQGWVVSDRDEVILTAYAAHGTKISRQAHNFLGCPTK